MTDTITVSELLALCQEQVDNGNGNKKIVISSDDEGNNYHSLFFGFSSSDVICAGRCCPPLPYGVNNYEECIVLG